MNKLSSDTAKLISSLQVITGVESVVKELAENSLDAGATSIEVKLENFGLSKIEVRDNGSGIEKPDIEYAAQVHYTSKISCQEDLDDLHTYGFRGEALSSLCEVAEVFIATRTKNDTFSTKYSLSHSGQVVAARPCHLVQGTTVTALGLFTKMPVRRQLYQSISKRKQALKLSEDILMSLALIYPSVQISLIHNGSIIWQKPKCADIQNAIENVLGSTVVSKMISVQHSNEQNQINLNAFIPVSNEAKHFRKSNDRCFIYVNKRPVRDKDVERSIKFHMTKGTDTANHSLKWPAFFLDIEVPYDRVDANVVSDKSQVMISSKGLVLTAVEQMLSKAYSSMQDDIPDKENSGQNTGVQNTQEKIPAKYFACNTGKCLDKFGNVGVVENTRNERQNNVETLQNGSWSKGQSLVSNDGLLPVEPVRVLGCSDENQPKFEALHQNPHLVMSSSDTSSASFTAKKRKSSDCARLDAPDWCCDKLDATQPSGGTLYDFYPSPISNQDNGTPAKSAIANKVDVSDKMSSSSLNVLHVRPAAAYQNSVTPPAKSKSRMNNRNSTAAAGFKSPSIKRWVSENSKELEARPSDVPKVSQDSAQDGPLMIVRNDVGKTKFNILHKKQLRAGADIIMNQMPVGAITEMKVGVVLDHLEKMLYLADLTRLQEARLFYSLMENHCLQTEDLAVPISISASSLSGDARRGLDCLMVTSDPLTSETQYTDDRMLRNGFRVILSTDHEGKPTLYIKAISSVVSYYGINDFTGILSVIGVTPSCTVFDTRPFKVVHYLQGESVRMSRSLPVDVSALRGLDELQKYFPKGMKDWTCFHEKNIFHHLFDVRDHL